MAGPRNSQVVVTASGELKQTREPRLKGVQRAENSDMISGQHSESVEPHKT